MSGHKVAGQAFKALPAPVTGCLICFQTRRLAETDQTYPGTTVYTSNYQTLHLARHSIHQRGLPQHSSRLPHRLFVPAFDSQLTDLQAWRFLQLAKPRHQCVKGHPSNTGRGCDLTFGWDASIGSGALAQRAWPTPQPESGPTYSPSGPHDVDWSRSAAHFSGGHLLHPVWVGAQCSTLPPASWPALPRSGSSIANQISRTANTTSPPSE